MSLDDPGALAGATLAHSIRLSSGTRLRKGHVLAAEDVASLREDGFAEVTVAIPDSGDLMEDAAACAIADTLASPVLRRDDVGTGRVNFYAAADGVFVADAARIDRTNRIDPAVTIATLANHSVVHAGQMVATVKIIPFAVAGDTVARARAELAGSDALRVHPFADGLGVALIQTRVAGTRESVLDKTREMTAMRLSALNARIAGESRCPHSLADVARALSAGLAGADMAIVFGASAITDGRDVIPAAIEVSGGAVKHVGMPVDPGNLLVLGAVDGKPVIGAPGCARSPKENGFDWVLQRLCAGIDVTADDIVSMGVGGLLAEIPLRPHPRETGPRS